MKDIEKNIIQIISTLKRLLYSNEEFVLFDILNNCKPTLNYETSDFGIDYYTLFLNIDMEYFSKKYGNEELKESEEHLLGYISDILRGENQLITTVIVRPMIKNYINWEDIIEMYTKESLIQDIEEMGNILIDVSTGKKIEQLNEKYISIYNNVNTALEKLNIENPNPYEDLWEAYKYWNENLATYAERRIYFSNIYKKTIKFLKESSGYDSLSLHLEYTSWQEVDRKIAEIKKQFKEAKNEEQFNAIGAICRSTYISLAEKVYDPEKHKTVDEVIPSKTDYKRKLEAFINYKLSGNTNEMFRSHCRKTLALADELTHKTTANQIQTALTITALISVVNIIKILNGNTIKL